MDPSVAFKIGRYAAQKYAAAESKIMQDSLTDLQQKNAILASRGLMLSGAAVQGLIVNAADRIKGLVRARAEAVMEAHELYSAHIEDSVLVEARQTVEHQVVNGAKSIAANHIVRQLFSNRAPEETEKYIEEQLRVLTSGFLNEISCEVERRKVIPKMSPSQGGNITNNVFHLHGHGSKVNINSVDESVTSVNISQQELFTQVREMITKEVAATDQEEILRRLTALEHADKSNAWDRFKDFISVGSVAIKNLGPYLPALTEWAHKLAS